MANYQSFVAFDTETTGLDSQRDQIIEVAGVKFDLVLEESKVWPKITGTFSELVKPTMYIPPEATRINHITDQMVENARPAEEVLPDFFRFCGQSNLLVAHNASFDVNFLSATVQRLGLVASKSPVLDSLKLARKIMNEAPSHALGELAKRLRREIRLNLNSDQLHRALYDCEVLAQVFIAILRKHYLPQDFELGRFHKVVESLHGNFLFIK